MTLCCIGTLFSECIGDTASLSIEERVRRETETDLAHGNHEFFRPVHLDMRVSNLTR